MSRLVCRNVRVRGHRTSMRLEPEFWDALDEIAGWGGISVDRFCETNCGERGEQTSSIRVAVLQHYRNRLTLATMPNPARSTTG